MLCINVVDVQVIISRSGLGSNGDNRSVSGRYTLENRRMNRGQERSRRLTEAASASWIPRNATAGFSFGDFCSFEQHLPSSNLLTTHGRCRFGRLFVLRSMSAVSLSHTVNGTLALQSHNRLFRSRMAAEKIPPSQQQRRMVR